MILINNEPTEYGSRYYNEVNLHVDNLFDLSWQHLTGLQILIEQVKNRSDKSIKFNSEILK